MTAFAVEQKNAASGFFGVKRQIAVKLKSPVEITSAIDQAWIASRIEPAFSLKAGIPESAAGARWYVSYSS